MAESGSQDFGDSRDDHAAQGSDSELRLLRPPEGERVVLPDAGAQATDEEPTIISKASPTQIRRYKNPAIEGIRGRTLAHFELIEPIGVGGMAAVIRARDKQLDRFVALKILPPEMAKDDENVRRFHQEARAAAKLDHENIARVFFCGEDQGLHFIAFEFVEGRNVRAILEDRGHIPVAEAVRYVLQIAAGLEHAASRGVVHRDIKPSNIIVSPNGRAKLVDMGLARSLEPTPDLQLTQSGVTLGTFDYISPEQALEPRQADSRSDIYSLGCTFYHMLTGQPPVPDGTAAKKLHFHQHVPPVDPREINPDIPTEVAAILARMMAKDVHDRYQSPRHLVQHLLQAAHQVGAGADVPDGVLFVDAPLPNPPKKRPLMVISLAALGLAVMLFLLSLAPNSDSNLPPQRIPARENPESPGIQATVQKPPSPLNIAADGTVKVDDPDIFHQAAANPAVTRIVLLRSLDLTKQVTFASGQGRRQLIVEADKNNAIAIRMRYRPSFLSGSWAGLAVNGGDVSFRNLDFELDTGRTTSESKVACVAIRQSGMYRFFGCRFRQKNVPPQRLVTHRDKIPIASVLVDNIVADSDHAPMVRFDECYFQSGQAAIALRSPTKLQAENCAFFRHGTLCHVATNSVLPTTAKLWRCSAFVVDGPAFRIENNSQCELHVDYSIFSCPENRSQGDPPHLVYLQDKAKLVRFKGKRNCYHNLNAFLVSPVLMIARFSDWQARTDDVASTLVSPEKNPWEASEPLAAAPDYLAFNLNPKLTEVRLQDGKRLGIERCTWGPMASLPPLPTKSVVVAKSNPNEKIVDPDVGDDAPDGVYRSLSQAVFNAKKGDVILIKASKSGKPLAIDRPIYLKSGIDLTIRAYDGHTPVLTLKETVDRKPALFSVHDSKLQIENLQLYLHPNQMGLQSQSIVKMIGNGSCVLKQCSMTLRGVKGVNLQVVLLDDPENATKMAMQAKMRSTPEIRFQDCFIRGEGSLVFVPASRPAAITLDNSLVALNGSLLDVFGINKATERKGLKTKIKLRKVSTFLTKPFLHLLAADEPKGLVPTHVEARSSLFVTLASKTVISLIGVNVSQNGLRDYIEWDGADNAYSGFSNLLDQERNDDVVPLRFDKQQWKLFATEQDSVFVQAKFKLRDLNDKPLSRTSLSDFEVDDEDMKLKLENYGAILNPIQFAPLIEPQRMPSDSSVAPASADSELPGRSLIEDLLDD